MTNSASDKRRSPRVGAPKVVVRIPSADRFRSHYLKDLSEGGLFIRAATQLPVGSELQIELWPPDEAKPLLLPAKVLRAVNSSSSGFDGEPGMAVAFTAVSPEDARRLKSLIETHGEGIAARAGGGEDPLGQVQRMVTDLSEARGQNSALEEELTRMRAELEANAERFRQVEVENTATQTVFGQVSARRDQLETELSASEASRAQATSRRDQLEAEVRRLKAEAANSEKALETANTELGLLRAKVTELGQALEGARGRDRELSKLLSGASRTGTGAAFTAKSGRKPPEKSAAPEEEITIERGPAESPITTESVEFAFDQMAGTEEPTVTATSKNPAADEPFFAIEDIDLSIVKGVKPASADPLDSFLGSADEATDVQVSVDLDPAVSMTGGPAGFVMGQSIVEGRKGYELFSKDLKRTTRLMPAAELAKRKPSTVDEALLAEMLSASPTFGTVLTQMGGQVKEERLRQMLYELYARALMDLRDY